MEGEKKLEPGIDIPKSVGFQLPFRPGDFADDEALKTFQTRLLERIAHYDEIRIWQITPDGELQCQFRKNLSPRNFDSFAHELHLSTDCNWIIHQVLSEYGFEPPKLPRLDRYELPKQEEPLEIHRKRIRDRFAGWLAKVAQALSTSQKVEVTSNAKNEEENRKRREKETRIAHGRECLKILEEYLATEWESGSAHQRITNCHNANEAEKESHNKLRTLEWIILQNDKSARLVVNGKKLGISVRATSTTINVCLFGDVSARSGIQTEYESNMVVVIPKEGITLQSTIENTKECRQVKWAKEPRENENDE